MKLRLAIFSLFSAFRLAMTLDVGQWPDYFEFSMFSVPFLFLSAIAVPKLAAVLLIVYALLFLASLVLIFIPKTRVIGCCLSIAVYLMDLACLLVSHLSAQGFRCFWAFPCACWDCFWQRKSGEKAAAYLKFRNSHRKATPHQGRGFL